MSSVKSPGKSVTKRNHPKFQNFRPAEEPMKGYLVGHCPFLHQNSGPEKPFPHHDLHHDLQAGPSSFHVFFFRPIAWPCLQETRWNVWAAFPKEISSWDDAPEDPRESKCKSKGHLRQNELQLCLTSSKIRPFKFDVSKALRLRSFLDLDCQTPRYHHKQSPEVHCIPRRLAPLPTWTKSKRSGVCVPWPHGETYFRKNSNVMKKMMMMIVMMMMAYLCLASQNGPWSLAFWQWQRLVLLAWSWAAMRMMRQSELHTQRCWDKPSAGTKTPRSSRPRRLSLCPARPSWTCCAGFQNRSNCGASHIPVLPWCPTVAPLWIHPGTHPRMASETLVRHVGTLWIWTSPCPCHASIRAGTRSDQSLLHLWRHPTECE